MYNFTPTRYEQAVRVTDAMREAHPDTPLPDVIHVSYGCDHALGYWLDVFPVEAMPHPQAEQCLAEFSTLFGGLTASGLADLLDLYEVGPPQHHAALRMDLPI